MISNAAIQLDQKLFSQILASPHYNHKRLKYGTSGFRYHQDLCAFISFRVGIFSSLFGKKFFPRAVGLIFTASHNPSCDNGIKMIRDDCEMLLLEEEAILEDFMNQHELSEGVEQLIQRLGIAEMQQKCCVILGHDTRQSAAEMKSNFLTGFHLFEGGIIQDMELSTTPALYKFVHYYNQQAEPQLSVAQLKEKYLSDLYDPFR